MKKLEEKIVLGGGCFWCIEAVFSRVRGVSSAISGYAGGSVKEPTYEQVCSGKTGHAEVTQVTFDPAEISLEDILRIFFSVHDPTTLNRQGNDMGTQYRSVILYSNEKQKETVEKIMQEIEGEKIYEGKIVTELKPLEKFYPAEEYHQHYFQKNPDAAYCQIVIAPKVGKFRKKFQKFYV
jgi:peptide-methionine (S)-S-oxide reductase